MGVFIPFTMMMSDEEMINSLKGLYNSAIISQQERIALLRAINILEGNRSSNASQTIYSAGTVIGGGK